MVLTIKKLVVEKTLPEYQVGIVGKTITGRGIFNIRSEMCPGNVVMI